MNLTKEQLTEAKIVDEEGVYDCRLITQQFAYKILGDQVSPLGDIFCFNAPTRIGPLNIEESIVLAGEIPNTNMFGAVCFQRLYATQIGSLLSLMTGKDYYVDDSSLFTEDLQVSLAISNQVKDSVVFHMIFPIIMYKNAERFSKLDLSESLTKEFKHNTIESFKYMLQTIFVETRRDNF